MKTKSLLIGLVIGLIVGAGGMWLYGQQLRDNVADVTEDIGDGVRNVGEEIEEAGDKIR